MSNKIVAVLLLLTLSFLSGMARADAVISGLTSTSTLLSTDEIPWCQGCTTSTPATQVTLGTLSTYLGALTQTLTNKTMTSPTLTTPTLTSPTVTGAFTATGLVTSADLASVITGAGPIGSASVVPIITFNPEGQLTTVTSATIVPTAAALETNFTAALTANFPPVNGDCLVGNATPAWVVSPCPGTGGGGSLTVTDGTHNVTATTTLTFPSCFVISGSAGSANAALTAPNRTITSTTGDTFTAADMCGQVNLASGATVFTVPAVGSGIWNVGATASLVNSSGSAITITNTATVNGACGGATFILPASGTCVYTSNGTSVDSAGLLGFQVLSAPVILTATASLDARTQCGQPLHYNSSSAGTITVSANTVAAGCQFPVVAVGTGLATIASGGTLVGNTACLATPRTKGQYSTIWVEILSNAGSAPVVNVSGDCG